MQILITGGTGFIGAEVARFLVHQGNEPVTLFDPALVTALILAPAKPDCLTS